MINVLNRKVQICRWPEFDAAPEFCPDLLPELDGGSELEPENRQKLIPDVTKKGHSLLQYCVKYQKRLSFWSEKWEKRSEFDLFSKRSLTKNLFWNWTKQNYNYVTWILTDKIRRQEYCSNKRGLRLLGEQLIWHSW